MPSERWSISHQSHSVWHDTILAAAALQRVDSARQTPATAERYRKLAAEIAAMAASVGTATSSDLDAFVETSAML